jgi:hypothetical protein
MASAAAVEHAIRTAGPGDEPGVLALMRVALGESPALQRTPDMWRWKHVENPFGPSEVLVAVTPDGSVVGLRAFMRWRFLRGQEVVPAVRAVDTATHPDVRRMGLFSRLTLKAVDNVREQGTAFVFNTPNNQSRPGYLKMGWQSIGLVRPLVRVLNPPRFAWGLAAYALSRRKREAIAPRAPLLRRQPSAISRLLDDDGMDGLLAADAALWTGTLHTPRSREYLAWRYARHPSISYWAATTHENGRLAAAAVYRTNARFGLRELVITEVLVHREDPSIVRQLLRQVIGSVRADHAVAYFPQGSFHRKALQRLGFLPAPKGGMTLVANPLQAPFTTLTHLPAWGLSLGDLEIF